MATTMVSPNNAVGRGWGGGVMDVGRLVHFGDEGWGGGGGMGVGGGKMTLNVTLYPSLLIHLHCTFDI